MVERYHPLFRIGASRFSEGRATVRRGLGFSPVGTCHPLFRRPGVRGGRAGAGGSEPALGGSARSAEAGRGDGDREARRLGGRRRPPRASEPRTGSRRWKGTRRPGPPPPAAVLPRRMRAQEPTTGRSPRPLPGGGGNEPARRHRRLPSDVQLALWIGGGSLPTSSAAR